MKQRLILFAVALLPLFFLSSYISPSPHSAGSSRNNTQMLFKSDSLVGTTKLQGDSLMAARSKPVLHKSGQVIAAKATGKVHSTTPCHSPVTTKNLHGLDGKGYLNGSYVDVYNAGGPRAYSESGRFLYTPSSPHFDEVSLYYHIENFRNDFIEPLAREAGTHLFGKIKAYAHNNKICHGGDNACDVNGSLYFSDIHPFAEMSKIVYHEYSHLVIHDILPGIQSSPDEEGAINEGLADFWAGSFTNRPVIGNCAGISIRNMAHPMIRSYSEYKHQPNYPRVEPHSGGEFFSAILWDLRSKIGKDAIDFLTFNALYRITNSPDFTGFEVAMLKSDNVYYGGANNGAIINTFAAWGIEPSVLPIPVGGPVEADPLTFPLAAGTSSD
jgi:hypothetical protein